MVTIRMTQDQQTLMRTENSTNVLLNSYNRHFLYDENNKKVKQYEKVGRIYWCSYMSEGALGEADLANSQDGYNNYGGEG